MSNNITGSIETNDNSHESLTPFEKAEISVAKFYTNIKIEQKLREILERIDRSKKALSILSRVLEEERLINLNNNDALITRALKKKAEIEQEIEFLELAIKLFFEASGNNIPKV